MRTERERGGRRKVGPETNSNVAFTGSQSAPKPIFDLPFFAFSSCTLALFFSRGESPWLQISIVTEPPLFTAAIVCFLCLLRFAMDD
eukprot:scaffold1283_cov79-Skeletonema_dohrnii-CCMP3373.AAC.3